MEQDHTTSPIPKTELNQIHKQIDTSMSNNLEIGVDHYNADGFPRVLCIANIEQNGNMPLFLQKFIEGGCDTEVFRAGYSYPPWSLPFRIKRFLGFDIRRNAYRRRESLEKEIRKTVEVFHPDIVIETNAMILTPECAEWIRKDCFLCARMIDRISFFKDFYEEGFSSNYDSIYTYSIDDCEIINAVTGNAVFIPAISDGAFSKVSTPKDIDISFIGTMYPAKDYSQRWDLMKKLSIGFPDLNIFVGGECAPRRRPDMYLEWALNKRYREVFANRRISQEECNEVYNRSKICLSVERAGTGRSWSGRLVDLLSTGSFVLSADESDLMHKYFDGCLVFFHGYDDLARKIEYYLCHEEEREIIAARGLERVTAFKNDPSRIDMSDDILRRASEKFRKVNGRN